MFVGITVRDEIFLEIRSQFFSSAHFLPHVGEESRSRAIEFMLGRKLTVVFIGGGGDGSKGPSGKARPFGEMLRLGRMIRLKSWWPVGLAW